MAAAGEASAGTGEAVRFAMLIAVVDDSAALEALLGLVSVAMRVRVLVFARDVHLFSRVLLEDNEKE